MALAVSGSVYENKALEYLAGILPNSPRSDLEQLLTGTSGSFYDSLSSSVKDQVVQQVTYAIRETFYYMLVSTALGLIMSLFLSVSPYMLPQSTHPEIISLFWITPVDFLLPLLLSIAKEAIHLLN